MRTNTHPNRCKSNANQPKNQVFNHKFWGATTSSGGKYKDMQGRFLVKVGGSMYPVCRFICTWTFLRNTLQICAWGSHHRYRSSDHGMLTPASPHAGSLCKECGMLYIHHHPPPLTENCWEAWLSRQTWSDILCNSLVLTLQDLSNTVKHLLSTLYEVPLFQKKKTFFVRSKKIFFLKKKAFSLQRVCLAEIFFGKPWRCSFSFAGDCLLPQDEDLLLLQKKIFPFLNRRFLFRRRSFFLLGEDYFLNEEVPWACQGSVSEFVLNCWYGDRSECISFHCTSLSFN